MVKVKYEGYNTLNKIKFMSSRDNSNYNCVLCGRTICLDNSYSDKGNKMICDVCRRKHFKDINDMFIWMEC